MKNHSKNIRRSVRLGIPLTQPHMAAYLAGAVGTAAMLGAPQAEAAVTAVTFNFGPTYTATDGTGFWSVGSFGSLYGGASGTKLYLGSSQFGFGSVYHTASQNSIYGRAKFFANGTVIGGGGNGLPAYAFFQSATPVLDFTSDQLTKNIGFKTSSDNWGWANVSWNETAKSLTINGAFVESVAGNSITINESLLAPAPEPSRALLALAGLGGVALRRRRKLAAGAA